MELRSIIEKELTSRIKHLQTLQRKDGSWRFCFEGALLTECGMILTMRAMRDDDEPFLLKLVQRIQSKQHAEGYWCAYPDENGGSYSTTLLCYTALLTSGYFTGEELFLQKTYHYLLEKSKKEEAHFLTRFFLYVTGLVDYPSVVIPISILLLGEKAPLNLYGISNYARVHAIPMIVCWNKNFKETLPYVPNVSFLHQHRMTTSEEQWLFERTPNVTRDELFRLFSISEQWNEKAYEWAESFMKNRIEENGTLYTYVSCTLLMIFALRSLGYERTDAVITKALQGIKQYLFTFQDGTVHLENSPSEVWDTALISDVLQRAGLPHTNHTIMRANRYLLTQQHTEKGDWSVHAPALRAGGFGFTDGNRHVPDVDDTAAVLRSLWRWRNTGALTDEWDRAFDWLVGIQNSDGGWGAFEKDANQQLFTLLPFANAKDALLDESSPDLTGRVLQFLGRYEKFHYRDRMVQRAVDWLLSKQHQDGYWYGKWGVYYIYGTWAAVTGLRSVGVPAHHEAIKKAVIWLQSIQHGNGGWGESGASAVEKKYVDLHVSTPSQTAWATDALISCFTETQPAIENGMKYLLKNAHITKEERSYPTGLGLPGQFYIQYHSYNYIFPILTMKSYLDKFKKSN